MARVVNRETQRYLDVLRCAPASEAEPARALGSVLSVLDNGDLDGIETVALYVAGPALIGFTTWLFREARIKGFSRLAFLSRDGQIAYKLAGHLHPDAAGLTLDYVPCSRRTLNLASLDVERMDDARWLFNSFMRSNASDLCARLGLSFQEFVPLLSRAGVSLDPESRAVRDNPQQLAMNRFLRHPDVIAAVRPLAHQMRGFTLELIEQRFLNRPDTAIVDAGWTGVMLSSLFALIESSAQPQVLLWGYQPRKDHVLPPDHVSSYHFDLRKPDGALRKLRDEPFLFETFCMSDHGIVNGYRHDERGRVMGTFSSNNPEVEAWGLRRYRSQLFRLIDAMDNPHQISEMPITIHRLLSEFWLSPTLLEAMAWASYPYDSDPTGTAVRPLAAPFDARDVADAVSFAEMRGDRAWVPGSLCLSTPSTEAIVRAAWLADGTSA
jgi:hypothetical protein